MATPSSARRLGAVIATAALVWLLGAAAVASASTENNGTLKTHELGTPAGTPSNDPTVCIFDIEALGLDPGQTGFLVFDQQGNDDTVGIAAGPFAFGPAGADGSAASAYFNPPAGHYKVTLYGKADQTDAKAKSKVFTVTCQGGSWPGDGGIG